MDSSTRAAIAKLGFGIAFALVAGLFSERAEAARAGVSGDANRISGTLFVKGADGVQMPAVALSTEVEIGVSGLVARARVTQHFSNDTDMWLEGVYVFPLPEMAAVDQLFLKVGPRRIEGQIQERAKAKRSYQRAKSEGRTASLLEQERPNLFTTSVANIAPWEQVEIQIEYQQTLRYEKGSFELRFPMTLTARYVPGGAEAPQKKLHFSQADAADGLGWAHATYVVPDAPRISPWVAHPDLPVENPLDLRVILDAGFPIAALESPSHRVDVAPVAAERTEVWVKGVPANRDFVLRWTPARGHAPTAAIFSEEWGGETYALLMVLPPDEEAVGERIPRESVFVIDISGSMSGPPIEQAKSALHMALERLAPDDTFNVIAFDDQVWPLFDSSRSASSSNLLRAERFVADLAIRGGTQMLPALELALDDPDPDESRLRQVVFITDGGIANETQLFAAIERALGRSRLFMVGIGSAPNSYFLNRAAVFGRGTATSIASQDEVGARMEELFAKIESPVLSDLELHWNDRVETWPERLPDLYAGEPVLVAARLERFVGEVRIVGRRNEGPFELALPLSPGVKERGIHKLWARRKIAHWMGMSAAGVKKGVIRETVLEVALEHQLVSKFTSLVAVDVTPRLPLYAAMGITAVPNLGPAGFDPSRMPGVLPRTATPGPTLLWIGAAALLVAGGLWGSARRA